MRLPDFVVAGARKCGTTWLHEHLASEVSIFLPPATKELFFFDRYWDRGIDWYANYFSQCPEHSICGEISPSYFDHPDAPRRMRETLPHAKLVFMLRSPVDRARSLYEHMVSKGDVYSSFEDALARFPELVDEGLYFKHLSRFERAFGRDACHVIILEDIASGGEERLRELYGFIGLSKEKEDVSMNSRSSYERRVPRSHFLAKAATGISRGLHHFGLHSAVRGIKALGAQRIVYSGRREPRASISPDLLGSLQNAFRQDVQDLSRHLNRDLIGLWNFGGEHGR